MAVSGYGTGHRVYYQQPDAAQLLHRSFEDGHIPRQIERGTLPLLLYATDEVTVLEVSACGYQAGQKGIRHVIFTAPDQHLARLAPATVRPCATHAYGGGHCHGQGGFTHARRSGQ